MKLPEPQAVDRKGLRQFGLTTGAIFAVLFGVAFPWLFDHPLPIWPWIIAAVLVLLAAALPNTLGPVYKGWITVGYVLGWLNTRVVLALLFYVLLLPAGLIMRLFGTDPMERRFNTVKSYRVQSHHHRKEQFERPF
jgi:amino acid transporter